MFQTKSEQKLTVVCSKPFINLLNRIKQPDFQIILKNLNCTSKYMPKMG